MLITTWRPVNLSAKKVSPPSQRFGPKGHFAEYATCSSLPVSLSAKAISLDMQHAHRYLAACQPKGHSR
jgi:hypothetical protein